MKLFPLYLMLMLGLLSCEDNLAPQNEEEKTDFVFGWSFGECNGDCATLYKFDDGELFPDDVLGYMPAFKDVVFRDEALNDMVALGKVKQLIDDFPDFLIESTEESFGCPDCGDWGAIHIMLKIENNERWWTLDNMIDGNPEEIQDWAEQVQMLINQLIE